MAVCVGAQACAMLDIYFVHDSQQSSVVTDMQLITHSLPPTATSPQHLQNLRPRRHMWSVNHTSELAPSVLLHTIRTACTARPLQLYNDMLSCGIQPSASTSTMLVNAFAGRGQWDDALSE